MIKKASSPIDTCGSSYKKHSELQPLVICVSGKYPGPAPQGTGLTLAAQNTKDIELIEDVLLAKSLGSFGL